MVEPETKTKTVQVHVFNIVLQHRAHTCFLCRFRRSVKEDVSFPDKVLVLSAGDTDWLHEASVEDDIVDDI
jgi:hypothetical protein